VGSRPAIEELAVSGRSHTSIYVIHAATLFSVVRGGEVSG
jgi:hypothetical protein